MLTAKKVERVKAPGRYRDGLMPGLLLQVSDSGAKSWVLRYMLHGTERMMGLGSVTAFNLREARDRARAARQLLVDGIDPLQSKRAAKAAAKAAAQKALTFREAAQRYFDQHEKKWTSSSHRDQFLSSLRAYAFGVLGGMDVATIDTAAVLRALEPVWTDKAITANRVRSRVEAVIDWATVRGYRSGDNPARWKGHLDQVLPGISKVAPVQHHPAMDYSDVPAFLTMVAEREDSVAGKALTFLIHTAARAGEVNGARWSEIDFDGAVWVIPAARTKTRKEHRVPLTPQVLALLRDLPTEAEGDFVFIGPRPGRGMGDMALTRVLERLGRKDVTVHGFRSAFRTWAAERTNFPREVAEQALGHAIGAAVERAYARTSLFDKRQKLMAQWSKFISQGPIAVAGDVTPIRGGR